MSENYTREEVKKIIIEWAKDKSKQDEKTKKAEIVFDESFCGGFFVRYKTEKMTKLIPDNSEGKSSTWKKPYHFAYEIECNKTILNLLLSFNYKNISDETKQICEEILEKYKMMPKLEDVDNQGYYRRSCVFEISIKDQSPKGIWQAMDKLFYQMKGYEEFICFKMDEEKKKKSID